jgi:hypothetical protein
MHNKTRKLNKKVFNNLDYKSNDGMLTAIWGPSMWHYLHTMSFNYPVEPSKQDKDNYRTFVLSLKHTLPCGKCRDNLKKNFESLPLLLKHMKNRDTFSRYIYDLHEHINTMLGKKSNLSYDEVRDRYEHFRARCITTKEITKKEKGCVTPINGVKSKCVLKIVPHDTECQTIDIDSSCIRK